MKKSFSLKITAIGLHHGLESVICIIAKFTNYSYPKKSVELHMASRMLDLIDFLMDKIDF